MISALHVFSHSLSIAQVVLLLTAAMLSLGAAAYAMVVYRTKLDTELRRNAAIVASCSDAIFSTNGKGVIRSWNPGAEHLYGYSPSEALGKHFSITSVDPAAALEIFERVSDGFSIRDMETRRKRKDGSLVEVSLSVSNVTDDRGRTIAVSAISRDISQRKQAERDLRASEERYRLATRATNDIIWDWDLGRDELHYGEAIQSIFGHSAELMTTNRQGGKHLIHPDDLGGVMQSLETFFASADDVWSGEYRFLRSDGSYATVCDRALAMRDENGKVLRMVGSMRDATMERVAAETMAEARHVAEAANRSKSEFLANMSHEIRTPMNGVHGMLDLALETPLRPDQRDLLETAKASADLLLTIINDILDVSKIEAGKLHFESAAFALSDVVRIAMRPLALRAADKGLRFALHVAPDLPSVVNGDSARFRQVLINLVGNAIKFTADGEVAVSVMRDTSIAADEFTVPVQVVVRDTGIGIAPNKHESIFTAFVQEDASTTRRYGGTGLGLAIAGQLATLMGGGIRVESRVGEGSAFYFRLCFEAGNTGSRPTPAQGSLAVNSLVRAATPVTVTPLRILVAEDNPVNQKVLTMWLGRHGHVLTLVASGREAVAEFQQGRFDLILMDVHMPDLGGFEATQLIRAQEEGTGTRVPIIAVTARAMKGDRERCLAAGMDDYLSKPVSRVALFEALEKWSAPSSEEAVPTVADAVDRDALLLLVDGDTNLLAELVALFASEIPRLMSACEIAIAQQDAAALREATHAIKGSAASMTAATTAAAAARLEAIADSKAMDEAPLALFALGKEVLRAQTAFSMLNLETL